MWSFALWDKTNRILFCSRDRFGIKPFYYINENGRFYFGSEYKLFKDTSVFKRQLNLDHVNRGLQLGWVSYHDQTYFSDLNALPAASNLIYKDGKISVEKYWDLDIASLSNRNLSESDKVEKFKSLFLDSIRLHMRSDVEVGGCLSGGLDSSSIASAVSVLFPENKFKTFSIYYEGKDEVDERPWVNKVLEKYPILDDYSYTPGEKDVIEGFEKTIFCNDVPVTGSSPISQNFVMKLVREKGIKVLLDGQGSDEYLAGYMHSFYRLIGGMVKQFKLTQAFSQFNSHVNRQQFGFSKKPGLLGKSILAGFMSEQKLYEFEYNNYYPYLSNNKSVDLNLGRADGTRLNNFLYHLLTTTSLPSLLHFEDRNSMMYSIESRVPFLDHRLVEFAFSLADEDKFKDGITKIILRKSMQGILPESIINRYDKKGFVTPGEVKWLRGPLNFLISDMENQKLDFLDKRQGFKIAK
ncbi:MAG: asparagine synthase (glutamine-hydrolyzing) [Bacteroidetes bacterium]|nr:asparagine synthase (glutamine-hydrolyzing) [Bacteroidota bacterium]